MCAVVVVKPGLRQALPALVIIFLKERLPLTVNLLQFLHQPLAQYIRSQPLPWWRGVKPLSALCSITPLACEALFDLLQLLMKRQRFTRAAGLLG